MAIYKYTLKKYAKTYSTWIIMIITAILIFFAAGILPFKILTPKNATSYSKTILILIPSITIFLSIFSSVFSGFKSANMFKDEVEDGTFLIMISKPITRSRILIFKWLSLQTFLFGYSIFTSGFLAITLLIFDNGDKVDDINLFWGFRTLKENAFVIFGFVSIILYVMSLTFSSITIFLSTKFSVSTTLGISIALGVVIPITSLVRTFTQKKENWVATKTSLFKKLDWILNQIKEKDMVQKIKNITLPLKTPNSIKNLINSLDFKNNLKKYNEDLSSLSKSPKNIYNLGISTGEENVYKKLWFLDTNFQISELSSLVYDMIIPNSLQENLTTNFAIPSYNESINDDVFNNKNLQINEILEKFDDFVEFSWNKTKRMRADFLSLWLILMFYNWSDIQNSIQNSKDEYFLNNINNSYNNFMSQLEPEYKGGFNINPKTPIGERFYYYVSNIIQLVRESSPQESVNKIKKVYSLFAFLTIFSNQKRLKNNVKITSKKEYASLFYSLTSMVEKFLIPIESSSLWEMDEAIKEKKLSNWRKSKFFKNSIKTKTDKISGIEKIDFSNGNGGTVKYDFTKIYVYFLLNEKIPSTNQNLNLYSVTHARLIRLLLAKAQFNRITRKEYASKYEILIIFISIAIALVPLTYLFIRKKDFR